MGLIDFARNAGIQLGILSPAEEAEPPPSDDDARAATYAAMGKALEARVLGLGIPGIEDLEIIYKFNGMARVFGTVPTNEIREKVLLTVGNCRGVVKVDDNLKVLNPEPPCIYHTVVDGDWLSKLAERYYGDPMLYNIIFEANKPMIKDPDEIFVGQVIRVPDLSTITHTVVAGDTLGSIAKYYYNKAARYTLIFEANRDQLDDPNVIEPGQVLKIPDPR